MDIITDIAKIDTRDDRREIWHLLNRLMPSERFAFLEWACKQVPAAGRMRPLASSHRMRSRVLAAQAGDEEQDLMLTNEVYTDLGVLSIQYGLSFRKVAVKLEEEVRRRKR